MLEDVRLSLRALSKNPGFFAVASLTLALGVGAPTQRFSVSLMPCCSARYGPSGDSEES